MLEYWFGLASMGPGACSTTSTVSYYYDDYEQFTGYTVTEDHPVGRRTGMEDAFGQAIWEYDGHGRMALETKTVEGDPYVTAREEWCI